MTPRISKYPLTRWTFTLRTINIKTQKWAASVTAHFYWICGSYLSIDEKRYFRHFFWLGMSYPNHLKVVDGIRNLLRYGIVTQCRMESSRSDAWHQAAGHEFYTRHVRLRRNSIQRESALMPYQACGLNFSVKEQRKGV